MPQLCLRNITLSHSSQQLLENANLFIEAGERATLIGRNGAGKSTLLKLINGEIEPDKGCIEKSKNTKVALLPQEVPKSIPGTIREIVAQCFAKNQEDWQVDKVLSKLSLNGELEFNSLSGGLKRLVILATILVQQPDILLLDEPTNHLDITKISLLEDILLDYPGTLIFVTHDRALLQKLATHIIEIDNCVLHSWHGSYNAYLNHKTTLIESEERANALFDKKLALEEQWIRQGIKARRTRNEGRVRQLKKMRDERNQRRTRQGKVKFTSDKNVLMSGKVVFEVNDISFCYKDRKVIQHFSTLIQRGDKIGIIGPNGAGKTTLINLLLGKLNPSEGQVKQGTKLTIGYFDQQRIQLDEDKSIFEMLTELGDTITIGNKKMHIMSYLQDFLFTPTQARVAIKYLSGGERNRVMLAKIFSQPCNVLVLDEPTNDLDIETLELLEELLLDFNGTLLLISHDRAFLNNVATSVFVFEENGKISEYVGGYDDWESLYHETKKNEKSVLNQTTTTKIKSVKLSYKEKKELDELPTKIELLEQQQHTINLKLANPDLYKEDAQQAVSLNQELLEIEQQLQIMFERWDELEKKSKNCP